MNFCNNLDPTICISLFGPDVMTCKKNERGRQNLVNCVFTCSFFLVTDLFQGDIDSSLLNARI